MHEQEKMDEARYFYGQIQQHLDDRDAFKYNLSAFLSAARSVLQYALKEAERKTGGQAWYDGQVTSKSTVAFFKDRRNVNIHAQPVETRLEIEVTASNDIGFQQHLTARINDVEVVVQESSDTETVDAPTSDRAPVQYTHTFTDWESGSDNNVLVLGQIYLDELQAIVDDGVNQRFLTP